MKQDNKPNNDDGAKLKELIRLSRLAKISGWLTGLLATSLLVFAILLADPDGISFIGFLLAIVVGFTWHRSVQLVGLGREMRQFSSFEDYLAHVKEQLEKEEKDKDSDLF